jgi:NADH-quinone oxidoreductase subunit L
VFGEGFRGFETWLAPVLGEHVAEGAHHDVSTEWALMLLSVAVAVAGILLARYFYLVKPAVPDSLARATAPLYRTLLNKWYVDEIYDFLFVNGLAKGGGTVLARFDSRVVDGGVNGAGWLTRFTSTISIWWDTWIIDGAVRLAAFLVKLSSFPVRILQTGLMQSYALVFVLGVAAIFGYYLVR